MHERTRAVAEAASSLELRDAAVADAARWEHRARGLDAKLAAATATAVAVVAALTDVLVCYVGDGGVTARRQIEEQVRAAVAAEDLSLMMKLCSACQSREDTGCGAEAAVERITPF